MAFWPVIHHADEVWQYLEPANHLARGPWVMTWEMRAGARSWLLPLLFAGPLAIGHALAPGTFLGILLARFVCVAISLGLVAGAMGLGFRLSRTHGLVAGIVAATWYELVYFGPRTMSEPIATALFLAAAWSLLAREDRRRIAFGGLLLGLCSLIRFQYAPAAFVLAIAAGRRDARSWLMLAAGAAAALCLTAAADLAGGAVPLRWIVRNISLNLWANRSASYGTEPVYWYVSELSALWGWALLVVAPLSIIGARRYPALFAAALVNLAVHSLVPHKEYRFILLTTATLATLGAIGSVDLWRRHARHRLPLPALLAGWLALSVSCAALGVSAQEWGQNGRLIEAWRIAASQPRTCGVGIYRPEHVLMASYALFGGDAPIYEFGDGDAERGRASRAFNLVMAPFVRAGELPGYVPRGCGDSKLRDQCVFVRPGACSPTAGDAAFRVTAVLQRNDF